MSSLPDEELKEKCRINGIHDPLACMKDAIDWSVFPELLKDLYRNDTDHGARPDIPVTNHGQGPLPAEHVQHGGRAGEIGDYRDNRPLQR